VTRGFESKMSATNPPENHPLWPHFEASTVRGPDREEQVRVHADSAVSLDLRSLFERNYASVWRLLRRFGVLPAQLDDAAQEVFWVAARRLPDIQPDKERSFLYGVALRVASNEVRRRKAAAPIAAGVELGNIVDVGPGPDEQLEQRQARQLLDEVLDSLPLDLRTVFVLAELEGLEVKEIAELERIPVGTASSRLRRAREEFSAVAKRVRASLRSRGALY
jgi:RNA polymerase sigma-70 factor, ECF subfamily